MKVFNSCSYKLKNISICSRNKEKNPSFCSFSCPNEKPQDKCGIVGISSPDSKYNIAHDLYLGLMTLQHRGQESAGISIVNSTEKIYTFKDLGLVAQALDQETLKKYWGNFGIGHVRYGTTAGSDVYFAQPYHIMTNQIEFSYAFNGTIANYMKLKVQLEDNGLTIIKDSDTEVLANLLASLSIDTKDWIEIFKIAAKFLDGSYSLTLLTPEGDLYAVRDPYGFKPLCHGKFNDDQRTRNIIASESCVMDTLHAEFIGDIKPGQILHIDRDGNMNKEIFCTNSRTALCQFEFVYFARPDSVIDGVPVNKARENFGKNLAKEHPVDLPDTIVVPIPDSGRSAALGFAKESGLTYEEGLMKNRYSWRTFIMPTARKKAVSEKLNAIRSTLKDKNVVLVDDSIVRGTTISQIISLLRRGGAKSVHVRISCPPVKSPCYMGIDFPTKQELLAGRMEKIDNENYIELIRKEIGADSLGYQSLEGLIQSIGLRKDQLCLACLTEEYLIKSIPDLQALEVFFERSRNRD
jgi:amidophosphoribosyltransferase